MGNYIRVPTSDLVSLGTKLNDLRDDLKTEYDKDHAIYDGLEKYGNGYDGVRVGKATGEFCDEWKTSIQKLSDGIGKLGDIAIGVGKGAEKADTIIGTEAKKIADGLGRFHLDF